MYADDTSVTCSAEDIDELCSNLRAEVDNIAEWLRQSKLSLNADKTEYMVAGHKRQTNRINGPLEVNINGGPIKRVKKLNTLELQRTKTLCGMINIRSSKLKSKMLFRPCRN